MGDQNWMVGLAIWAVIAGLITGRLVGRKTKFPAWGGFIAGAVMAVIPPIGCGTLFAIWFLLTFSQKREPNDLR